MRIHLLKSPINIKGALIEISGFFIRTRLAFDARSCRPAPLSLWGLPGMSRDKNCPGDSRNMDLDPRDPLSSGADSLLGASHCSLSLLASASWLCEQDCLDGESAGARNHLGQKLFWVLAVPMSPTVAFLDVSQTHAQLPSQ